MTRGLSSVEKRLWPVPTWSPRPLPGSGSYLDWTRPCSRPRSFWPSSPGNRGARAEPARRRLLSTSTRQPAVIATSPQGIEAPQGSGYYAWRGGLSARRYVCQDEGVEEIVRLVVT